MSRFFSEIGYTLGRIGRACVLAPLGLVVFILIGLAPIVRHDENATDE